MIRQGVGGLAIKSGAFQSWARDRTHNRIPLLLTARWITGRFYNWTGAALGKGAAKIKKEMSDVSGAH
jgi:hypothetical protein